MSNSEIEAFFQEQEDDIDSLHDCFTEQMATSRNLMTELEEAKNSSTEDPHEKLAAAKSITAMDDSEYTAYRETLNDVITDHEAFLKTLEIPQQLQRKPAHKRRFTPPLKTTDTILPSEEREDDHQEFLRQRRIARHQQTFARTTNTNEEPSETVPPKQAT